MATTSSVLMKVQGAIGKRIRTASKLTYQAARWRNIDRPTVLFIVGCQRSGTTLMTRLFDADINCRVFGEFSELSSADKRSGIRLNPLPDVAAVISSVRAPLVVAKPLVETQNVRTLLNYFHGSKALFMYRRYADVALSDLAKFGERNGIENIRPIAEGNAHNWRSAGASREVHELIRQCYSEKMNRNDAAALFWFARNHLFFDLDLPSHPAVMLCRYEHLTEDPLAVMRRIYEFLQADCSDLSHITDVRAAQPKSLEVSDQVRAACERLQSRLDVHYALQTNGAVALPRTNARI